MNIKTNNMNLELNNLEVTHLKEVIYDYIDRIGGFDQLSDEMKCVLEKLSERGRESAL